MNKDHIGSAIFHRCSFHCLKQQIYNTVLKTILTYFDCTKPKVIQTNASEYGLSTALIQSGRLIAFASKTLTNIKTRYANIEWDAGLIALG